VAELVPGVVGHGWGATLIGVRVTPISGFSVWDGVAGRGGGFSSVATGAGLICAADGGGGGGAGGGTGALAWVGWTLLGAGWAVVDAFGDTVVDSSAPVPGLRNISRTPHTTMAASAAAASAVTACLVRYHGRALLSAVHLLILGVPSRLSAGGRAWAPFRGISPWSCRTVSSG
jgi:hypothetical protein